MSLQLFISKLTDVSVFLILLALVLVFDYKTKYISEGETEGICEKVEVEVNKEMDSYHTYHDVKSYIPYIRYEWKGISYLAKSYRSYSTGIYFPNDKVKIKVNKKNKDIVYISELTHNLK